MKKEPMVLPALRGQFGDWVYYTCLFPIRELGLRVDYAHDIHKDKELSRLIQRVLEGRRADRIAQYLTENSERFFSSLVLATYGGDPHWLEIGHLKAHSRNKIVDAVPGDATDNLGFLYLTGKESMFAVDGQHRLAGIKKILSDKQAIHEDLVPVIVVGHKKTRAGLQRTRRLFTTLNKTAVPVTKRDIIALDEDDVMAITVRRLVEDEAWFSSPKIAVVTSHNLTGAHRGSLTTISNLYDVLKRIFVHDLARGRLGERQRVEVKLRFNRPSDERLDYYREVAMTFFEALSTTFRPVRTLFVSKSPERVTPRYRHEQGGHLLFRPVGLEIITRLAIEYAQEHDSDLPTAIKAFSEFPVELSQPPFRDVIWNPSRGVMNLKGKELALDLGRHMMRLPMKRQQLLERYRAFVEDPRRRLPNPVL
ncbi:DNA sulfur modification protein DndB [Pseudoxanthomonas sp. X-1]|uniref:DGQHR domain-containing protein n=1 Tax=Pseudoxanthomonas sp. X-1 TaxID=2571115 RepID=UPI00110BFD03|nr:DNA sulfur modification protein DndB [Pseudoxanthomonas sp. X-1]TMN24160.1 DGQHR domain-containing protein [Pseudoxanthomonas sp. X-1]UAY75125.1 DGQHR domain-containing protein [Pseudoxanthomonas sp. X-1]